MSKKSFKDNPALQFMSRAEEIHSEPREERVAEVREIKPIAPASPAVDNFRVMPMMVFEAKSKRFNMLIRPSVFSHLKKISESKGTSVNDLINTIVENYIEDNGK